MTAFAAFDVPAIIGWGNRIFTFSTYLYLLLIRRMYCRAMASPPHSRPSRS